MPLTSLFHLMFYFALIVFVFVPLLKNYYNIDIYYTLVVFVILLLTAVVEAGGDYMMGPIGRSGRKGNVPLGELHLL